MGVELRLLAKLGYTAALLMAALNAAGDARSLPWAEFMAPVQLVCQGRVIAARELIEERPKSEVMPDGAVVTKIKPDKMISTIEVYRSLRGHCPATLELRWSRPMPFPAFSLNLNHVLSNWVLFLAEVPAVGADGVGRATIEPRYAWESEYLTTASGGSIRAYHPQHIHLPSELEAEAEVRAYCSGSGIITYTDRHVAEAALFSYLSKPKDSP